MKLKLLTFLIFCLIAICKSDQEEYGDYDDEPSPAPVTPAPVKPTSRLGGLLAPRNHQIATKKTAQATSTTPKPVEPVEEEPEDDTFDEKLEDEVPVTTTESSKKLKAGVVRPFRSNDDLLAALKRRRAQVCLNHSKEHSSTTPASVEATPTSKFKSASNGRSRNNGNGDVATKTTSRGRFGTSRGSKPVPEETEETQHDEVQVKPKPYRRG